RFEQQLKAVAEQVKAIDEAKPLPAQAVPPSPQAIDAQVSEHEILFNLGNRRYRVRGFEKNSSYQVMKINLLVSCHDELHVDTFDLYHAKARNHFIQQAAAELKVQPETIKTDVGKVLLKL